MKARNATVLVIDDDEASRIFIERAFRSFSNRYHIQLATSGDDAVAYLDGEGKYANRSKFEFPSFVITDLNMTPGDGFTVLEFLKNHPALSVIPVIMMSSSHDDDDIRTAYVLGASSFVVKPDHLDGFKKILKNIHDYWIECEVPQVDEEGFALATNCLGKPGERFTKPKRHSKRQLA